MKKARKMISVILVFMFLLIQGQAAYAAAGNTTLTTSDIRIEYNTSTTQIQAWVNAGYKMVSGLKCYLVVKGKDGTDYYLGDKYTELTFKSSPPASTSGNMPNRYYGSWSAKNKLYLKPGQYKLGIMYTQSGKSASTIWKNALINGSSEATYISITEVNIRFEKSSDKNKLTNNTIETVKTIAANADISSLTITSTVRTPEEQARAMYDNIRSTGAASQKKLYGAAGDEVIDVYTAEVKKGSSQSQILAAMTKKIKAVGPAAVSRHCLAEGRTLDVLDIASSSIANQSAFKQALKKAANAGSISKYIDETGSNGCYHLEIVRK